jgi:hypothetical protein
MESGRRRTKIDGHMAGGVFGWSPTLVLIAHPSAYECGTPLRPLIASRTAASPHGITAISLQDSDVKSGRSSSHPRSPVQIPAFSAVLPHPLPIMPLS